MPHSFLCYLSIYFNCSDCHPSSACSFKTPAGCSIIVHLFFFSLSARRLPVGGGGIAPTVVITSRMCQRESGRVLTADIVDAARMLISMKRSHRFSPNGMRHLCSFLVPRVIISRFVEGVCPQIGKLSWSESTASQDGSEWDVFYSHSERLCSRFCLFF